MNHPEDLSCPGETVESFKKSFFYGSRSDLSFKFLADLDDRACTAFIQALFRDAVDALDDGDLGPVKDCLIRGQVKGYQSHLKSGFEYDDGPFTSLPAPLSELTLTLLTSSGHFAANDDPAPLGVENMSQKEAEARVMEFIKAEPLLSAIPFDTAAKDLRVRHGGYDVRGALKDPNVTFPLDIMKRLLKKGRFAALTQEAYSFVGACSQKRLLKNVLPGWVEKLKGAGAKAAVLVPV